MLQNRVRYFFLSSCSRIKGYLVGGKKYEGRGKKGNVKKINQRERPTPCAPPSAKKKNHASFFRFSFEHSFLVTSPFPPPPMEESPSRVRQERWKRVRDGSGIRNGNGNENGKWTGQLDGMDTQLQM